jgi:hypothetical protein
MRRSINKINSFLVMDKNCEEMRRIAEEEIKYENLTKKY